MTRYEPYSAAPMRRMVERMFNGAEGNWMNGEPEEGTLPVDIFETPDELVVRAALPGFTKDRVDVQVERGVLSIRALASDQDGYGSGRYYRREINWGSLSRRIALPGIVDDARVHAEFSNGILTLHIPIAEQAKPRRVEIKES